MSIDDFHNALPEPLLSFAVANVSLTTVTVTWAASSDAITFDVFFRLDNETAANDVLVASRAWMPLSLGLTLLQDSTPNPITFCLQLHVISTEPALPCP